MRPGDHVGAYTIISALGAGGMGEVYRARDTKLNRDVAIKVLPGLFTADPDRLARFQREAQILAALNHPNIAHVHGLEELPAHASALVMELVEGDDLSTIIARGALPLEDALPIARQIAEGLEAAHEQGIVHRDLKPGNVKVRGDGRVKLLDFGLAVERTSRVSSDLANSPTFTSPVPLTHLGVILGTAAYMAPEQARGKAVDRRADVWAFGCVLYEMLTATRAFDGETVTDVLAAIVSREPDWSRLPPATPLWVRDVLRRCLRKDPAERLRDLGDVRLLLSGGDVSDGVAAASAPSASSGRRRLLSVLGWTLAAGLAVALAWVTWRPAPTVTPRSLRFELPLTPRLDAQHQSLNASFALSPDAARLVYVARQGDTTALYLRDLESGEVRMLPDTGDGGVPIFSPDGAMIAFTAGERLRTLQLSAQLARDLTAISPRSSLAWSASGDVLFPEARGLARIPAGGGDVAVVAPLLPTEFALTTPNVLPDGRHLLVGVRGKAASRTDDAVQIAVVDPVTNEHRVLVGEGASPALLRTGTGVRSPAFLIYARSGRLWAATFDLERMTVGPSQAVVDNVEMRANGEGAQFSISADGTLAYLEASRSELVWVDRAGRASPVSSALRRFALPRLSPDERAIAVELQDVPHQVWHLDPARDLLTPMTQAKEGSHNFAWSPDGRSIAFTASVGAASNVMWMLADGSGTPQELLPATNSPWLDDWSRDGRSLALVHRTPESTEVQVVPLEPGAPPKVIGPPRTVVRLPAKAAVAPEFSPDGQWIAWCDCQGNKPESTVNVTRISDGRRYQVSVGGGTEPKWSDSGRELFFRKGNAVMAIDITLGPDVRLGRPRMLFEGEYLTWGAGNYDVTRDGRFVMVRSAAAATAGRALSIRLHWGAELERLLK